MRAIPTAYRMEFRGHMTGWLSVMSEEAWGSGRFIFHMSFVISQFAI
jgi:hypothetical protein